MGMMCDVRYFSFVFLSFYCTVMFLVCIYLVQTVCKNNLLINVHYVIIDARNLLMFFYLFKNNI